MWSGRGVRPWLVLVLILALGVVMVLVLRALVLVLVGLALGRMVLPRQSRALHPRPRDLLPRHPNNPH